MKLFCWIKEGVRLFLWIFFSFEGRIPREVFWLCAPLSLGVIPSVMAMFNSSKDPFIITGLSIAILILAWFSIAIMVKRFHDVDRSSWNLLWGLLPFYLPRVLAVCLIVEGTDGENRFGPPFWERLK